MPPHAGEIAVLVRISARLHELGDVVHSYAASMEGPAREGTARSVPSHDIASMADAWNNVGRALLEVRDAPVPASGVRPHMTDIEADLTRVIEIVRGHTT